jgi:flagellar hook-basal body complex protein FliE
MLDPRGSGVKSGGGGGFGDVLQNVVSEVEGRGREASQSIESFLSGEGELHTTALATQRAEIAFEFFLQGRNKVVQAYQEIMRMPM